MNYRDRITLNDAKNQICSPSPAKSAQEYALEIPLPLEREVTNLCRTFKDGRALSELMRRQKLPLNYASLTGELYALDKQIGAQFDSPLAKDYLITLEFNPAILSFSAKPLTVGYDFEEKRLSFQPDVLVHFCPDHDEKTPRPWLVDIRTERDIHLNAARHDARSAAAQSECERRGWEFRVLTEAEIRTPYLSNARFFIPFRKYDPIEPEYALLQKSTKRSGYMTAAELIRKTEARIAADPKLSAAVPVDAETRRARLLSMIWRLVALQCLTADFHHSRVDENTLIWNPFFGYPERS